MAAAWLPSTAGPLSGAAWQQGLALVSAGQVAAPASPAGAPNPFRAALEGVQKSLNAPAVVEKPARATQLLPPSARQSSDDALKTARQALAMGDLPRAQLMAERARQLNVAYDSQADSPEDVAESIEAFRQLQALKASPAGSDAWRKGYAKFLVAQSKALAEWSDWESAERAVREAEQLSAPAAQESGSQELLRQIAQARTRPAATKIDRAVLPASAESPVALAMQPAGDSALPAAGGPQRFPEVEDVSPLPIDPFQLLEKGEQALRNGDRTGALQSFRAAYQQRNQLDLVSQQRLQGHLQMLSANTGDAPAAGGSSSAKRTDSGLMDSAGAGQSVLAKQIWTDINKRQAEAAKIRESDPKRSLELLQEARTVVEKSELDDSMKKQLYSRLDLSAGSAEQYLRDNEAEIELATQNREVLDSVEHDQKVKLDVQQRIAKLVDEFNGLVDEQRFAEAEVIANRLYEMAPEEMVAQQIWRQAKMIRREKLNRDIIEMTEDGVAQSFLDARLSAAEALADSANPINYKDWVDIVKDRSGSSGLRSRRSPKLLEIEQKLKTPVLPKYDETPLTEVVDGLSKLADVNIHLDPRGLSQEGVRSDVPVTLNLPQEVSLKSALTLILEPLHLTYTIKDEVLKITSEQIRDGEVYQVVYNVADLVVPIPNFVPSNNMGLQGLINDAYAAMGYGPAGGVPGPVALASARRPGQPATGPDAQVLAQQFGGGGANATSGAGGLPLSAGPGGAGGAANADFDSLIDLITSTVEHDSWMENGTGEGEIQPFPTNLSLVISQTQRVHEQIADLLEQLRRLQDLQVTIEVRFIRLTDSFFERIGVDFDFNIEDGTYLSTTPGVPGALYPGATFEPRRGSATVGLNSPTGLGDFPNFTVDLDIPYRSESFGLAAPQFGTPQEVATFGFSVLSDIEAYFLIHASQGDRRSNVLQAPKVTLFNGQQGVVVDSSFVPFVISVIPVVGEFAAAQQPVIVVLSEGTMLTVQAVVSDDRRYVRLTLVPFFSQIGEVREFTFEGSETISASSNTSDADGDDGSESSEEQARTTVRSGTTVQLPTFQVISVSTTVSVPDGGTVLLGGIKRLREGRNEFGVPLLSKIPYLDRLFRNVGIGRETDSLMMMVTPHIIIQEEEEERLGISAE